MSVMPANFRLNRAGDTIVEVMIVLTVLSLAISIAYATANRSLLNARQAQESSQATELVQAQVEALRTLAGNDPSNPNYIYQAIFQSNLFCVSSAGAIVPPASGFTTNNPFTTIYPAACQRGNVPINLSISYSGAGTDTFTVKAVWDDVHGGNVKDSVTNVYRVHQ